VTVGNGGSVAKDRRKSSAFHHNSNDSNLKEFQHRSKALFGAADFLQINLCGGLTNKLEEVFYVFTPTIDGVEKFALFLW